MSDSSYLGIVAALALLATNACTAPHEPEPNQTPASSHSAASDALVPGGYFAPSRLAPGTSPSTVQADFSGSRVSVSTPDQATKTSLSLTAYGCFGKAKPVGTATRTEQGERVEYHYTGVTEWYQRDARGVEQGFTLEDAHCAHQDIELDVAVNGLTPRSSAAKGGGVDLLDATGAVRMHYTDLSARDARGRALIATMSVKEGRIALRVAARGAVYPVVVDPEVWSEQGAALPRMDGAASDYFGASVSVSGDTVVVGAYNESIGVNASQGAAYVYARSGTAWTQQGPPLPRGATDGAANDFFGWSVSVSGDTALVGAYGKTVGTNIDQGAAYVYVRTGTTWTQQGPPLARTDGGVEDFFGISVSVSGDTAVVGASGRNAVYVFVRSGTTWTQQGPPLSGAGVGSFDAFAGSVSVSGDTAVVGAINTAVGANTDQGAAYVFVRSGTTWTQQGPPLPRTDGAKNDNFGSSVSVSGNTAVVGAYLKTVGANGAQGAAYVFVRSGTTWTEQGAALAGTDGASGDRFGSSVSVSGDTVVVGAQTKTVGANTDQGAAYVFVRSGTTWTQQGLPLVRTDGAAPDEFGVSVSVSGDTAVVGALYKTVGAIADEGTAYVFTDGSCTTDADCPALAYCSNGICLARCAHDSECPAGSFCSANGLCQPEAAQGASCNEAAGNLCKEASCRVCATGNCVDGVCCESACSGTCEACSAALTGGADGACTPIPADQDPQNECAPAPGYPASCGAPGTCNGVGQCRASAKAGTACGDTKCSDSSVSGRVCDGAGLCGDSTVSCAPYVCSASASACGTSCTADVDCDAATGYCLKGTCAERKDPGAACGSTDECASGFCVDGECCNTACDGQCEACGDRGECAPVTGAPRGGRAACDGGMDVCGGSCDGTDPKTCKYPSSTVCQQSCTGGVATQGACDGKGGCSLTAPASCGGYGCDPDAMSCRLVCSSDSDCAAGFNCVNTACVPAGVAKCNSDLTESIPTDSTMAATPCQKYACDLTTGSCRTQCTSIDDCSSGNVCDTSNRCVDSPAATSSSAGGCGCRLASRSTSGVCATLLLFGLSSLRRRRKQRSPVSSSRERLAK